MLVDNTVLESFVKKTYQCFSLRPNLRRLKIPKTYYHDFSKLPEFFLHRWSKPMLITWRWIFKKEQKTNDYILLVGILTVSAKTATDLHASRYSSPFSIFNGLKSSITVSVSFSHQTFTCGGLQKKQYSFFLFCLNLVTRKMAKCAQIKDISWIFRPFFIKNTCFTRPTWLWITFFFIGGAFSANLYSTSIEWLNKISSGTPWNFERPVVPSPLETQKSLFRAQIFSTWFFLFPQRKYIVQDPTFQSYNFWLMTDSLLTFFFAKEVWKSSYFCTL